MIVTDDVTSVLVSNRIPRTFNLAIHIKSNIRIYSINGDSTFHADLLPNGGPHSLESKLLGYNQWESYVTGPTFASTQVYANLPPSETSVRNLLCSRKFGSLHQLHADYFTKLK